MNSPTLRCFVAAVACLLLAANFHQSEAKRFVGYTSGKLIIRARSALGGCTTFGHSCYGGMGKRGLTDEVPMEVAGRDDENPALVFTGPRSEYRPPAHDQMRLSPQQLYDLSPFLRQWLKTLNKIEEQRRLSNEN